MECVKMSRQKIALPKEMQKNNQVIFHNDGKQETMEAAKKNSENGSLTKKKRNTKTNNLGAIVI